MENNSFTFVKNYPQYQHHNNLIYDLAYEIHSRLVSWPFNKWVLDLIGKISPPSTQGHTYILTTNDYFTQWVEDSPLCSSTTKVICDFIL